MLSDHNYGLVCLMSIIKGCKGLVIWCSLGFVCLTLHEFTEASIKIVQDTRVYYTSHYYYKHIHMQRGKKSAGNFDREFTKPLSC